MDVSRSTWHIFLGLAQSLLRGTIKQSRTPFPEQNTVRAFAARKGAYLRICVCASAFCSSRFRVLRSPLPPAFTDLHIEDVSALFRVLRRHICVHAYPRICVFAFRVSAFCVLRFAFCVSALCVCVSPCCASLCR